MRDSWLSEIRLGPELHGEIPAAFRVEVEPERDAVRVCPIGEVDLGSVDEVRTQLEELRATGFSRLILDLRRTTFLDSSGLRMAVEVNAAAASDGFEFAIIPGPPPVQRVFELTGLSSQLPFAVPGSGANGHIWT
jgi:stage II sporulation protein AA (anti-sigma F factor antagonist)